MNLSRFNQLVRMGVNPVLADQESSLWKGGSTDTKSSSTQTSTPMQTDEYNKLLEGSNNWLDSGGFDDNYGGTAGYDSVANQNANQLAGQSGLASTGSNLQGVLNSSGMSSLTRYLGDYDPNNTGLTAAMDASNSNLDWNYGTQVAGQLRQGATNAGQYGSTRAGVAEGIAQSQLSQQKVNANSTLAYNDQQSYNSNQLNALTNLSSIAKGLGSGSAMQYDAGTLEQTQSQNEINGDLQKWAYENNVDLNDLLAYQSLISGDYGGTTTSTSKTSGGSSSSGLASLGSLAGTVAGAYVGGPVGASVGGSAGGLLFGS
jgi:hypothetical protein